MPNKKKKELRAALHSGDPYAIAKAFKVTDVSTNKSPSEPTPTRFNESLEANGVDFSNVAKLLIQTAEYATQVSVA
jgi:hypothetical protein